MSTPKGLITGATEGLGLCLAEELALRGFQLTVVGRTRSRLEDTIARLTGFGHTFLVADLADTAQVESLCPVIISQGFDLVVNNAGGTRFGRIDKLPCKDLQEIIQLNFTTPAVLSWAFLQSARAGAILVNVTSMLASVGAPGNAPYTASKAGLQCLTESLWYEAARRGVTVLDFRPVSLVTRFHEKAGSTSMAASAITVSPERAAKKLAQAIHTHRDFVYPYGPMAPLVMALSRLLPRRLTLRAVAFAATRAGYL